MNIGLIGCGKVGLAMCRLLKKDHRIVGVHDSSKVQERIGVKTLKLRNNPGYSMLVKKSDAVLVATPDDQIARASAKLVRYLNKPTLICHFSGLLPAEVIPEHRFARRVALHPFATFPLRSVASMEKRYLMLGQGDRKALALADCLFGKRHFTVRHIQRRHKVWYHLLGVFSSNLLVGLMKATDDIARESRISPARAREMAVGLIKQTLDNVADLGLDNALSGPVRRGDISTVKQHLRILRRHEPLLRAYCALSAYLIGLSEKPDRRRKLKRLLKNA